MKDYQMHVPPPIPGQQGQLPVQAEQTLNPPDQNSVSNFETIYFGNQIQAVDPTSEAVEIAKKSVGETFVAKIEAASESREAQLEVLEVKLNRIMAPGHVMTMQEAFDLQTTMHQFQMSETFSLDLAKKSGESLKTLFTNQ
jgi:hypothetical protein